MHHRRGGIGRPHADGPQAVARLHVLRGLRLVDGVKGDPAEGDSALPVPVFARVLHHRHVVAPLRSEPVEVVLLPRSDGYREDRQRAAVLDDAADHAAERHAGPERDHQPLDVVRNVRDLLGHLPHVGFGLHAEREHGPGGVLLRVVCQPLADDCQTAGNVLQDLRARVHARFDFGRVLRLPRVDACGDAQRRGYERPALDLRAVRRPGGDEALGLLLLAHGEHRAGLRAGGPAAAPRVLTLDPQPLAHLLHGGEVRRVVLRALGHGFRVRERGLLFPVGLHLLLAEVDAAVGAAEGTGYDSAHAAARPGVDDAPGVG